MPNDRSMTKNDAYQHAEAWQYASTTLHLKASRVGLSRETQASFLEQAAMCLAVADGYRSIATSIENEDAAK